MIGSEIRHRQIRMRKPSSGGDDFASSYINALVSSVENRKRADNALMAREPLAYSSSLTFGMPDYQASPLPMQANALSFGERLGQSESGGNYGSVNSLGYTGKHQFGDARIADFSRATGMSISKQDLLPRDNSPEEMARSKALQDRVFQWHLADIDRAIDSNGLAESGYSRDALRAVAHLGGVGGMIKFARSGGKYNPSDDYGTSLSEYAQKFR